MIDNFIQKLRFQRKLSLLSITFVALIAFNGSLETRKALSRFVYKYWEIGILAWNPKFLLANKLKFLRMLLEILTTFFLIDRKKIEQYL